MPRINEGWRAGGLLLHPTSLPSFYGIGDLGPQAHNLARFMKKAGLHYWQMLPLTHTSPGLGNSPYSAFSAFAGNPLLISPEFMARDGWLTKDEIAAAEMPASHVVDFERVTFKKLALIESAFERAEERLKNHAGFNEFAWNNGPWMNDYAFFIAVKKYFGGRRWLDWPEDLKRRDETALRRYGADLARPIMREKFAQYLFHSQLLELRQALAYEGLGLIGDAAIYVNHDSSDVWAQQHLFHLDSAGQPTAVAGVPPDYFSKDGQLWGTPLFNWPAHQRSDFDWWKNRLWRTLEMYDWVRLDHFRAFAAYWETPAGAPTAAGGSWRNGPGSALFMAASARGPLNIIAEDLGVITPDVTALRREFNYPGMRVLQFGFGPDFGLSDHAPFRIQADNAVYAATHDNNTTRGWYRQETTERQRAQLSDISGFTVTEENAAWALTRIAWLSPGALAIVPMQDLLNLDENSRMNIPGAATGNWNWKMKDAAVLTEKLARQMADLGALAGRDNYEHPNLLTY